jgi:copper transport protein
VLRAPLRALVLAVASLLALLGAAAPASAHAVLLGSTPTDASVLDVPPTEVELRFNEAVGVEPDSVVVLDADGERVEDGQPSTDASGMTVTVPLRADLPEGSYIVTYRVISADAHPVRGALVFSVGAPGEVAQAPAGSTGGGADPAETWLTRANRVVLLVGTLLAVGGLLFLGVVHDGRTDERRRLGRLVAGAAGLGALATVVGVVLQSWLLHGGLGAALSGAGSVLTSPYGTAALVRLAGLTLVGGLAIAAASGRLQRMPIALVTVAAVIPAASFALTGHTLTSEPRWLATAANIGHTYTGAAWFGGLVGLALCLRTRRAAGDAAGAGRIVARFSRLALGTVALLAVAGTTLAWVEVRSTGALLGTDYGRALLVKLGLLAIVAAAAAYNHLRLVPAMRRAGSVAAGLARLRTTVRLEVVGIVLALAATSVLVDLTPASRAFASSASEVAQLGDDLQVELTVDAARAGQAELHLYLLDELGRPVGEVQEVTLRFASDDAGIAPITRSPSDAGPGHWVHRADAMSVAGTWQVEAQFRLSDFDQRTAAFEVAIAP